MLSSGNENMGMLWAAQKIPSKFDKIWPLVIPNQISTISMQIPNLVKIQVIISKN